MGVDAIIKIAHVVAVTKVAATKVIAIKQVVVVIQAAAVK
jgi:hypothetical protein